MFTLLVMMPVLALTQAPAVFAQNAEEYFHNSGQAYIHSQLQDAINIATEGLARYPNDARLNALLEKLQQEQEQQQQQQQQSEQEQNQNQDPQQNQQEQEQNQSEQQQQNEPQEGESADENHPQNAQPIPDQVSKENAEKILQALAQKEKELLKEFKKQNKQGSARHEKDW